MIVFISEVACGLVLHLVRYFSEVPGYCDIWLDTRANYFAIWTLTFIAFWKQKRQWGSWIWMSYAKYHLVSSGWVVCFWDPTCICCFQPSKYPLGFRGWKTLMGPDSNIVIRFIPITSKASFFVHLLFRELNFRMNIFENVLRSTFGYAIKLEIWICLGADHHLVRWEGTISDALCYFLV